MKLCIICLFCAAIGYCGPVKVATYPVVHPVKVVKAIKIASFATTKGVFKAVKAIVW